MEKSKLMNLTGEDIMDEFDEDNIKSVEITYIDHCGNTRTYGVKCNHGATKKSMWFSLCEAIFRGEK